MSKRTSPEGDVRQDIGLLIARDTAALSAKVSRVCDPLCIWCPVEDTDLQLRMACPRIIASDNGAGDCIFAVSH
ncbi:hypothetical protein, partial [Duncaniella muris]|uniref:hypothetical protein n=1 Tax=Duncaniella muris TaxID=2094150 RepID=UPI0026758C6E